MPSSWHYEIENFAELEFWNTTHGIWYLELKTSQNKRPNIFKQFECLLIRSNAFSSISLPLPLSIFYRTKALKSQNRAMVRHQRIEGNSNLEKRKVLIEIQFKHKTYICSLKIVVYDKFYCLIRTSGMKIVQHFPTPPPTFTLHSFSALNVTQLRKMFIQNVTKNIHPHIHTHTKPKIFYTKPANQPTAIIVP